ncbi:MAG: hypothetical protein KAZ63_02290 [Vitreoscilla sp.]|nr:hypothetical protein [Vitreoscilla sp.]
MYGDFLIFERDGAPSRRAQRLAFGETSGRDEAWLRDTLLVNPEILPVRDIDPSFGPLVPLCRELRTEAGPLDVAFVNEFGRLTLVECKLWRNPEARRKVVAQVLDYARAISRWTYSDLQRQVAAATGRRGNVPYELVKERVPGLDEHRFVDETSAAMRQGRFLLLIAGDGIREDVGALAELINRNAASGFSFGLVEVALYGLEDESLVVQPRVVARTQNIERTVVVIRDSAGAITTFEDDLEPSQTTSVAQLNELGESAEQAAYREWWAPVMLAPLDDPDQEPPKLFWRNNVRTPLPWPGTWILAYTSGRGKGDVAVTLKGRADAYAELSRLLSPMLDELVRQLPSDTDVQTRLQDGAVFFRRSKRAADFASDDDQRAFLASTINTFVNVFRPAIKDLMARQHQPEPR